jgi:predicted molibdopterin-dependent oxidoreductase YjgC
MLINAFGVMITLGKVHAQKIMSGRYAKIHTKFEKSSWNALSRFNAAGLITFDCQDARDRSQRTYIDGFMTKDDALKLSDSLIPLPIMCLSLYQR